MDNEQQLILADILRRAGEVMFPHVENPVIDIHTKDSDGDTALHKAAFWGDVAAVKALLAAGANIDEPGDMGCTPLYCAVTEGHEEAAETLLSRGANPDIINEFGTTPRSRAARSSSERLRRLFDLR